MWANFGFEDQEFLKDWVTLLLRSEHKKDEKKKSRINGFSPLTLSSA